MDGGGAGKPGEAWWATTFPAWRLEEVSRLRPYERNSRKHSPAQIERIMASIREFGFTRPLLVGPDNGVVAGHGALEAAKRLGMPRVPVIDLAHLTAEQRRAYVIADNKLAELAEWDAGLLAMELGELHEAGFDLKLTGFDHDELAKLLGGFGPGSVDPDDAPSPPKHPVSRPGDVWLLGPHRIVCGDATVAADVEKALAGVRPHLMVTDPPYGVDYDPGWRKRAGIGSTGTATGRVLNDERADWRDAWALFPGNVAYVWHAGTQCGVVEQSLRACRFRVRAQIIWVKTRPVLSRGHYHHQHEPCFYAVRDGAADDAWQGLGDPEDDSDPFARFGPAHEVLAYAVREGQASEWRGGRKQSTVWFIDHVKSETGHGTQKPVEAMRRPIANNSSPGQAVYEPFCGSGTTIIACEMTGRACHALELSPAYVDVSVRRWQEFTGGVARLEADGRSFAEVAEERPIGDGGGGDGGGDGGSGS